MPLMVILEDGRDGRRKMEGLALGHDVKQKNGNDPVAARVSWAICRARGAAASPVAPLSLD
jgi:hypothetical protein